MWTSWDSFLPRASCCGHPAPPKPGTLIIPLLSAAPGNNLSSTIPLSKPGPQLWWVQKGGPLEILSSGFQKEAGSKAFLWQGVHLYWGSMGPGGGVCSHPGGESPPGQVRWSRLDRGREGRLASWILTLPLWSVGFKQSWLRGHMTCVVNPPGPRIQNGPVHDLMLRWHHLEILTDVE